jgi:hypothetical protein
MVTPPLWHTKAIEVASAPSQPRPDGDFAAGVANPEKLPYSIDPSTFVSKCRRGQADSPGAF